MTKRYLPVIAGLAVFWFAWQSPSGAQICDPDGAAYGGGTGADKLSDMSRHEHTVVRNGRRDGRTHESQAILLAEAGRTREAIDEDKQAIYSDPNNPGYQIFLASLLIDAGQWNSALAVYEQVCEHFPDQAPYIAENMHQLQWSLRMTAVQGILNGEIKPIAATPAPGQLSVSVVAGPPPVQPLWNAQWALALPVPTEPQGAGKGVGRILSDWFLDRGRSPDDDY